MYALVRIAGQQFRAHKGGRLRVPILDLEEGSKHRFGEVLLVAGEGQTHIGTPILEGAAVEATVLGRGRGEKVVVFKMKRRKKYRRRQGHRQGYTEIQVEEILLAP